MPFDSFYLHSDWYIYANLDVLWFWLSKTRRQVLQNSVIVNIKGVHFLFKRVCNDSLKKHFFMRDQHSLKNYQAYNFLEPMIKWGLGTEKRNGTTNDPDIGVIRHRVLKLLRLICIKNRFKTWDFYLNRINIK